MRRSVHKLREEIYLFHEIKPNFHCGDIHEIDALSAPFIKESYTEFFGNLKNCFSLIHGHIQSEYLKNALGSSFNFFFFSNVELDARTFQEIFGYQPQSRGCCMDIDNSVFNYVTARKYYTFVN